jgi:glycosidase
MKKTLLSVAVLALLGGVAATSSTGAPAVRTAAADTVAHPAWSRDAVIYEINVRQFTPEGTFAALQPHLPRLRRMGVDILWLMPVQPIGEKNRKGGLGSPYSIRDYTAINAEYGTEADFKRFVDAAHAQGMKVILDWVANHTAWDHAWITRHPDWYTRKPNGEISFPLNQDGTETDWTDVAELNYDSPAMRRAMLGEMGWWITEMGIDGFRADVAWGVPHDFWAQVRTAMRSLKPDVFLLAEAEDPKLHESFNMTYGWELHHVMNKVARGEAPVDTLDQILAKERAAYPRNAMRMHFTSNHDENSWQGTEFERMGANHKAAFVLSGTIEGSMPLLYTGQEVSLNKRLRFFEKDTVDWRGPSLESFYRSMFELKTRNPALHNGAWGAPQVRLATTGAERVYAFTRTRGSNTVLVAVNFGDAPARVSYTGLPRAGAYTDWFSKRRMAMPARGSLEIPAHGYRVLVR